MSTLMFIQKKTNYHVTLGNSIVKFRFFTSVITARIYSKDLQPTIFERVFGHGVINI